MMLQALISAFCIVVYLVSTVLCMSLFVARYLKRVTQERTMRQRSGRFPCGNCRYFTGESQLACAVNPFAALTEASLECSDFEANRTKYR